jgi:hydroxymethylpyrimidine pyrophosphatase-like HAD family hydrolase
VIPSAANRDFNECFIILVISIRRGMVSNANIEKAKDIITKSCLIAADIDKTFLHQDFEKERNTFETYLAPLLAVAATDGTNLAVITGNSLEQLSTRFFRYLVEYFARNKQTELLSQFHFFCNSGGVYFCFEREYFLRHRIPNNPQKIYNHFLHLNRGFLIKEKFLDKIYISKTAIDFKTISIINKILTEEWNKYIDEIGKKEKKLKKQYYLDEEPPKDSNSFSYPYEDVKNMKDPIDLRELKYGKNSKYSVQITLKPVLSWRHARKQESAFNNDFRKKIIMSIHNEFKKHGLTNYTANPGGKSSIDITKSKLDKAYALTYLIDKLGIEGNELYGKKFGSNVLYLGDEVISGGGNDYSVTKIDGVLVLAVNKEPKFAPFKSKVIIPTTVTGPEASEAVMSIYNKDTREEIAKAAKRIAKGQYPKMNAIDIFKQNWFSEKIDAKIARIIDNPNISTSDLQVLYTFITLISRDDVSSKKWMNIMVNELDEIMEALDKIESERIAGIGSSHPDN